MDVEKQKEIRKKINIGLLVALLIVAAIIVVGSILESVSVIAFLVIVSLFLLGYWWVKNFLEPKLTKELEGINEEQKKVRKTIVLTDLAGYIGMIVFLVSINFYGGEGIGILGLMTFALCMTMKQKHRKEFIRLGQKKKPKIWGKNGLI